jgi:hypothetical protein
MKLVKIAFVLGIVSLAACNDLDELLVNPNGVDPDRADPVALYNNIQLKTAEILMGDNDPSSGANTGGTSTNNALFDFTAGLSRMTALVPTGFTYATAFGDTYFDAMWTDVYADLFPDIETFNAILTPLDELGPVGANNVIKAYMLMMLVDVFGDIPVSEIGLGAQVDGGILSPALDDDAEVYALAISLLDEAIGQLEGSEDFGSDYIDNFYGGDVSSWATLAKTLKLRAAVTTRLVNGPGSVDTDDLIVSNGENWEYQYGNNRLNPSNRHPMYADSYENADPTYQSNWYMWLMAESKGFADPRTPYYFYRQSIDVYPIVVEENPNAFDCIVTQVPRPNFTPVHYEAVSEDMPYCLGSYSKSYFGRDHLNGSGIPPDGEFRTAYGLYPVGGAYDDGRTNNIVTTRGTAGAAGVGIIPIWQASWTHFILAEAALTMNDVDGDARQFLEDGINLSMERVRSFESLVDGGEIIATFPVEVRRSATFTSDEDVASYVEYVLNEFDEADDEGKLAIVAREYMIALFGNGLEAYNLYRRTCLPADIQPAINTEAGPFIRSAFYPAVLANRNINVEQKSANRQETVFWDTREAGCAY